MFSWGSIGKEDDNEDIAGDAFQMNDDLGNHWYLQWWIGFSDEENSLNEPRLGLVNNGSSGDSRVLELETELQQRDSVIQMKTDELRRIALLNHDYENEVPIFSVNNNLDFTIKKTVTGTAARWQGSSAFGE